MALTSEVALETAIQQLRSHQISELFRQTLGWQTPSAAESIAYLNQQCLPIAERDGVVVWQVLLRTEGALTTALRHQIYTALQHLSSTTDSDGATGTPVDPLVIFISSDKLRSLWCESATRSALYIVGSPMTLWRFRLRRFAVNHHGLFPASELANESASGSASETTFQMLVEVLFKSIRGIESDADRQAYSRLTLRRLILIQQMQQKEWLSGDTWYLHNRFGESVTQGENLFFANCLQPLYRSLSLPMVERPLALQQSVGRVPFLGQLFEAHRLEKTESITVDDGAFEAVLGWLSEQSSGDRLNPWMNDGLGDWLTLNVEGHRTLWTPVMARRVCDRALDTWLLSQLGAALLDSADKQLSSEITAAEETLNDRLFNADTTMCRRLVQEILPQLSVLDPDCGEGNLLVAFHQRLTEIFCILVGYIQQNQDAQLQIWKAALYENSGPDENSGPKSDPRSAEAQESILLKNIQERLLRNNLYGVGESQADIEPAHFQLLLNLVSTTQDSSTVEPLIDLEFSVLSGNSLIGFISVDEERFEQVDKTGAVDVLQGNLLQPLAADSYQTILSEKNIALEHYQSRSQVLAKAHSVPFYARAALLREEIVALDSKAQKKLDTLLLNQMGPQMGMRYRELQLTGKPQRRSLLLSDIEALAPLHLGYQFNKVIKKGGFDVVACCHLAPQVIKPTVAEFLEQFPALAKQHQLTQKTFKTSKAALQNSDPAVATAWLQYQDRCVFAADYCACSEDYVHQMPAGSRKANALRRDRLLIERCIALLSPKGVSTVVLSESLVDDPAAASLVDFLQRSGEITEKRLKDAEGFVVQASRK
ncbi:MAG: hypothetical protein AAFV85_02500 [Cyanobacteria bacterium J06634_6]